MIIPAFNEENRIGELLSRLISVNSQLDFPEVIVVDDGSSDKTSAIAESFDQITLITHPQNRGRGAAINSGILASHGDLIVILDADLEYFPEDLPLLYSLCDPQTVVYGNRYSEPANYSDEKLHLLKPMLNQGWGAFIANYLIAIWVWILFGVYYREHLSGIRIYPSEILRSQKWKYSGFEGDHEKAAVLLKENYRVKLAPIRYQPRTVKEGKKIRASDGFKAILVFLLIRIKSSK